MTVPMTRQRRFTYAIGCFLMCIAVIAVECLTVKIFVEAKQVQAWPTTQGIILKSELKIVELNQLYEAQIEYEFQVNGKKYQSSSVRTRGTNNKYRSDAESVLERFPIGSNCIVYYQDGAPEVSYLEAGAGIVNYIIIVSPLLFAYLFGKCGYDLLKHT